MARLKFLAGLAVLASLSACEPLDWSAYDSVNLISDRAFDSGRWATTTVMADGSDPYMLFEAVPSEPVEAAADLPDGFPADPAVYRLEIRNLFPNGNFVDTTDADGGLAGIQPVGWTRSGPGVDFEIETDPTTPFPIDANRLLVSIPAGEFIDFDLGGLSMPLADGNSYAVRFDFNTQQQTVAVEYHAPGTAEVSFEWDPSYSSGAVPGEPVRYPGASTDSGERTPTFVSQAMASSESLRIGSTEAGRSDRISGSFDNFGISRRDLEQAVSSRIPYELEGGMNLPDGPYRFSIWVKGDPTAAGVGTSADEAENRLDALGVHLRADKVSQVSDGTENRVLLDSTDHISPDNKFGEWTRLVLFFELQIEAPSEQDTELLSLSISPTPLKRTTTEDQPSAVSAGAGSILIAAPALEFLPDGIPPVE
jgi:hypothetical protein